MADNNSLLEKLEGLQARFEEVSTLITDPSVIADQKRYVKLTKEYKDLGKIVDARKEYIGCLQNVEDANDAVIAGQSMTETRMQEVDMAGPYFYASIVCVTQKDNALASATGISQLSGACTAQTGTIWYDSCLPQIEGAELMPASETAPAMIMAVTSGTVDYICTDMPTAMGACATYDNLTILDFTNTDDDFEVDQGEINIGISVVKGNTFLLDAMNAVLAEMTVEDFNNTMNEAILVQPAI